MTSKRMVRYLAAALALTMLASACGDDDDGDGDEAAVDSTEATEPEDAPSGDAEEYCALAAELDEQEDFPSVEQLDALAEAAPEEIKESIDFVVGKFKEAIESGDPGAAFADPEMEEAFGPIEEFETEECGLGGDDEEEPDQDPSVTEVDPAAAQVAVSAVEYDFEFETPAAGRTSFTMTNDGEETHVMLLAKLAEGATLDQALAAEDPGEFTEEEFESDVAAPGQEAVLTADLTAGDWAMVCYIPTADGTPHYEEGMAVPFTVG